MKTLLLTSIGSVSAKCVIANLKAMDCRVVGIDVYPRECLVTAVMADVFYQSPWVKGDAHSAIIHNNKCRRRPFGRAAEGEEYSAFIQRICAKEEIDFIIPLTDIDVDYYTEHGEWFAANKITVCMPPAEAVRTARNKLRMMQLAGEVLCPENNGQAVDAEETSLILPIPTLPIEDVTELPWSFPVICKPVSGRSSQGIMTVHSQREWEHVREILLLRSESYIVQPEIRSGGRIVADVVRSVSDRSNSDCVVILRRELVSTPHGCGLSVQIFSDAELEQFCRELAEKLNVIGCVCYEFLQELDGRYYFLECNPRFSAGVQFSCMARYDAVGNHLRCFMGEPIEAFTERKMITAARVYEEVVTIPAG